MPRFARPPQGGPLVIPNANQIILKWTYTGGRTFSNVLYCQNTTAGPLNPTVGETIFSAIKANAATTTFLAQLATTTTFFGVWVKDVRGPNFPMLQSTSLGVPGTGTGAGAPLNCAQVITLNTAFSGRGYRARVYLGGYIITAINNALQWTSASSTASIGFLTAVQSAVQASLGPLVVAQRTLLPSPNPAAPPPWNAMRPANVQLVTGIRQANIRIDSQRRRLGR